MRLFVLLLLIPLCACQTVKHDLSYQRTALVNEESRGQFYQPSPRSTTQQNLLSRTEVSFPDLPAGTIFISHAQRALYLGVGEGKAVRYRVGVGKDNLRWSGAEKISAKKEWPSWTPPDEMLQRRPDLPRHMEGGINNPLGARALYLGSTLYRIHGSNEPETIGHAVSSGCFRMTNDDVADLYDRVQVGTQVYVQ